MGYKPISGMVDDNIFCANFVLFPNPRDMRQLTTFASQILPLHISFRTSEF